MKEKLKRNYKLIIGIVIGVIVSLGSTYATTTISSSDISYDNKDSGLTSTNMKGAIDELYEKAKGSEGIKSLPNIVTAYTYNQTTGASNYCVTGEEETCKRTNCYETKTANSCPAGTIIKYKVNDITIVTFQVMFDNGTTLTMQSQENTINNTPWISKADYIEAGGTESEYGTNGKNDKGPLTALTALENATSSWSNVNNQTYTMGTTVFKESAYTGCDNSCTKNAYTLPERTAKARMITLQEVGTLGRPIWLFNYLTGMDAYWTMTASTFTYSAEAWLLANGQIVDYTFVHNNTNTIGARAVVEISK